MGLIEGDRMKELFVKKMVALWKLIREGEVYSLVIMRSFDIF